MGSVREELERIADALEGEYVRGHYGAVELALNDLRALAARLPEREGPRFVMLTMDRLGDGKPIAVNPELVREVYEQSEGVVDILFDYPEHVTAVSGTVAEVVAKLEGRG